MVNCIDIVGIIPARMESTRFPGKPLALIQGLPMIHHVYNNSIKAKLLSKVYIATNSDPIINYCKKNKLPYIETGVHETGSDRVFEAAKSIGSENIINIQGDEPMIKPELIDKICNFMGSENFNNKFIVTTHCECTEEELHDRNNVKVILSRTNNGIYYTRKNVYSAPVIPGKAARLKQIGVYAYTFDTLNEFNNLGYSDLEDLEKIEIMRWIDYGLKTTSLFSEYSCYSVDTIDDLVNVENILSHNYKK